LGKKTTGAANGFRRRPKNIGPPQGGAQAKIWETNGPTRKIRLNGAEKADVGQNRGDAPRRAKTKPSHLRLPQRKSKDKLTKGKSCWTRQRVKHKPRANRHNQKERGVSGILKRGANRLGGFYFKKKERWK